jgi:Ca2+-binding RTX toxin-like protein
MTTFTVGPTGSFPTITAAMLGTNASDTIVLQSSYGNETATVTHAGMTVNGGATSTGIMLHLGTGVTSLTLTGTAPINVGDSLQGNAIVGNAGNNVITVTGGADPVNGGLGTDRLVVDYHLATGAVTGDSTSNFTDAGGLGSVTITAGTFENFTVLTGSGADTLTVGNGNNIVHAGSGANTVTAGNGANVILGGSNADTITAGNGGNFIDGGDGTNIITSGAGNDTILTGTGPDTIVAGAGNDMITIHGGADTVHAGAGSDLLTVNYAASVTAVTMSPPAGSLAGYSGTIADSSGNTATFDGVETFHITSGSGNDIITTGGGNDWLIGGAGNDTFATAGGNDVLIGGTGNNHLDGGAGNDTASYVNATAGVTVSLAISAAQNTIGAGTDTLINIENLAGTAFNDTLTGDAGANTLSGLDGNDRLNGGAGNDSLAGGAGNDTLIGGAGNDTVSYVNATAGVAVSLAIATAQNTIGAGTDTLNSLENLIGSAFNDTLTGDAGANTLAGLAGNDRLIGGAGNDTLFGGAGADSFAFGAGFGKDTVGDFTATGTGHDTIDFLTAVFASFGAVQSHMTQSGANVVIALNASNTITLQDVTLASLTAADFTFHPGAAPAPAAAPADWATHSAELNSHLHFA